MMNAPVLVLRFLGLASMSAVAVSSQEQTCPSSMVLGTDGGFDVGGREPLCYVSRLNATLDSIRDNDAGAGVLFTNNTFTLINEDLYKGYKSSSNGLILLNRCFDQTELSVTNLEAFETSRAIDKDNDLILDKGETFRFRITIVSNLTKVNPDIDFIELGGNFTIHTRLNLCDALSLGSCNPLDDTTALDAKLTPFDTDVGASRDQQFPPGEDRWAYDPNTTLNGLTLEGGSRIVTRWVRWRMKETTSNSPLYNTSVDVSMVLPPDVNPGAYFVMGHVVMNFDVGTFIERIDIADAVLTNAVYVVEPTQVQNVSKGMIAYISVVIAIFALMQAAALLYMLINANHPAMKLAQGYFLVAMVAAGLVQTTFTFTYLPLYDWFCAAHGLAIILPMHVGGSIVVARIWRVHMTLSAAMKLGRRDSSISDNKLGAFDVGRHYTQILRLVASLPLMLCCKKEDHSGKGVLRQSVSALEAASLALMLSIPQVILQVVSLVYYGGNLTDQLDPSAALGRVVCDRKASWVLSVGVGLVGLVYISAVYIAWLARNLPSAFNEKDQVFQCAGISAILAFVSVFLTGLVAADPGGNPDILVFCYTIPPIGIAGTLLWVLVLPKLRRVASGEKIVVSALLGSRYSSSSADSTSARKSTVNTPLHAGKTKTITIGDPIPQSIELEVLRMSDILQTVQTLSADGRPLSKDEWSDFSSASKALYDKLSLLEFDWSTHETAPSLSSVDEATLKQTS